MKANKGICTKTSKWVNQDYFRKGDAFQINLYTNCYRNGIVTEVDDRHVVLSYFNNDELQSINVPISDIENDVYHLIKMEPDYREGQCSYKI